MSASELDALVTLMQERHLAAWRRMLGGDECVMVGALPLESGEIRGWRRAAHIWKLETGEWWVAVAGIHAGTFTALDPVAAFVEKLLSAPQDVYEQEIARLIALHTGAAEA